MKATPAKRGAALAAGLVLALPGTALAQGAGDNQYQDPFGSDQGSGSQQASSGSSSQGSSSQGSSSSGSSSSTGQLSGTPPGMNAAAGSGTLPRTGGEPLPLAALGTGLLLAGVGLRLRLRRPLG
jgi:hypothetical protein